MLPPRSSASPLVCVTSDGTVVVASDNVLVMQVRSYWHFHGADDFCVHHACVIVGVCASGCVRAFVFQCVHRTHF